MGEFNSDNHYIYYCGQESLRRNGVTIIVNKRVRNAVLGCNLKNDRMISVHFQGKLCNITVIQVYAPTSNAEEAEVEQFYEDLEDLLELTPRKDALFIIGKQGTLEIWVQSLSREDPLEKEMATHSNMLAWEFPGQRSRLSYCPHGRQDLDTTEQLKKKIAFRRCWVCY